MKWYKHDPNAALAGMIGLTVEERGAYYTLIDLLYARDGRGVRDNLVCSALGCHGNTWNALKRQLIEKGKIWEEADGSLMAKRVQNALKEAANFSEKQTKRIRKRWRVEQNQRLADTIRGNTSTPTPTEEEVGKEPTSSPRSARGREEVQASKAERERQYFDRGKEVLGGSAGGQLTKLLRAKDGEIALALAAIETASTKQNPREYIARMLHAIQTDRSKPYDWRDHIL